MSQNGEVLRQTPDVPNPAPEIGYSIELGQPAPEVNHSLENQNENNDENSLSDPQEWKSIWVRPVTLLPLAVVTVIFIGTVIIMAILSSKNHGLTSVNLNTQFVSSIYSFNVGIGLLWTFLPVLVFAIYALIVGTVGTAAGDRQPYVELYDEKGDPELGAAAEISILLDYRSKLAPVAIYKAVQYKHWMLAYSFMVILVLKLVLTALAAHLFFGTTVQLKRTVDLLRPFAFNDVGIDYRSSFTPAMEIVSSTTIYGGGPIPWTTFNESFLPYSLSSLKGKKAVSRNLTIPAQAYSINADCKVLDENEFELLTGNDGNWYFSINDRGCYMNNTKFSGPLDPLYTVYLEAYDAECSLAAYWSRVIVVAALNSNASLTVLTNKTAVSCIPSYYHVNGSLSLVIDSNEENPIIVGFVPSKREVVDPQAFGLSFTRQLVQSGIIDPTATLVATSQFAQLIYQYAKHVSPNFYLAGQTLLNATESMFLSTFSVAANRYLIQRSPPETVTGQLFIEEARLVVVLPVACTVIGILVAVLLMLAWTYIYTEKHKSILYEEPTAVLGTCVLLRNSDLISGVENVDANKCNGKVGEAFMEQQRKLPAGGWRFVNWAHPTNAYIKSTARPANGAPT